MGGRSHTVLARALLLVLVLALSSACRRAAPLADVVTVGAVLPLSGDFGALGRSVRAGIELAAETAGEGPRLHLRFEDDRGDTVAAAAAMRRFAEAGVAAIVGGLEAGAALAEARAAEEGRTVLLVAAATDPEITAGTTRAFRVGYDDARAGAAMARYAYRTLGRRRAAVIYDEGRAGSRIPASAFMETFRAMGGTVVAEQPFRDEGGGPDLAPLIAASVRAGPDAVFSPNHYRVTVEIASQIRAAGLRAALLSGEAADSPDLPLLGGAAVEGLAFPVPYAPDDRARSVRVFRDRFRRAYDSEPDVFAALGYDAMRLVIEALRRAGAGDADRVAEALAAVRRFDGVTGRITFDGPGTPRKDVVIVRLRGGRAVFHARINP